MLMDVMGVEFVVGVMSVEFVITHISPPHSYLTKVAASMLTQSPQLQLARSGNGMISLRSLVLVPDVPGTMWGSMPYLPHEGARCVIDKY